MYFLTGTYIFCYIKKLFKDPIPGPCYVYGLQRFAFCRLRMLDKKEELSE